MKHAVNKDLNEVFKNSEFATIISFSNIFLFEITVPTPNFAHQKGSVHILCLIK